MNQTLTERALVLEYALYKRGIEPVCPLGLAGAASRWQSERSALVQARQVAVTTDRVQW